MYSNEIGLPSLYQVADSGSLGQQRLYKRLLVWIFALTLLGVLLATLSGENILPTECAYCSAICLLVSVILSAVIRERRPDKLWYIGRAIAESVRTISWKYATCAEPYTEDVDEEELDRIFVKNLQGIIQEQSKRAGSLLAYSDNSAEISQDMRSLRQSNWHTRRDIYVKTRLAPQREWYAKKAARSQKLEARYFWTIILFQILAIISAFISASQNGAHAGLVSLAASVAAVLFGWLQVAKHQENGQAYSIAAQELGMAISLAVHVGSSQSLSVFVADSETAVSREHTMWLARRDAI